MKLGIENQNHGIGIHFNGKTIYGVRLKRVEKGVEVASVSWVRQKGALGSDASVDAVRRLVEKLQPPKGCKISLTTEFDRFYSTHLSIGEAPLIQTNKMARIAYQQEVNEGDEEFIFDYEHVGSTPDEETPIVEIHAFSAETSLAEILLDVAQKAEITPVAIFPQLFAYRNLIAAEQYSTPTALLVLVRKELRVGVVHEHKFIFTRTFKSGLDALLEFISQKVDQTVSVLALERALDDTPNVSHTQLDMEIRASFSYIIDRMQQQIERAFKFYTGRLKLPPINQMLIQADSTAISKNMASLLRPNYSHSVKELSLEHFSAIETGIVFLIDSHSGDYVTAAGAAMAAFQYCPNLLYTHDDQQRQRKAYQIRTTLSLVLTTLALICVSIFAVQVALYTPRILKKRSLARQMHAEGSSLTQEIIQSKVLLANQRRNDLRKLAAHYALQGYFYQICHLLPPELKVEHLHMELAETENKNSIGTLSLRGIVIGQELRQQSLLTKFLVELGSAPAFKNISKNKVSQLEHDAYAELQVLPFHISCELIYGDSSGPKGGAQ